MRKHLISIIPLIPKPAKTNGKDSEKSVLAKNSADLSEFSSRFIILSKHLGLSAISLR